MKFDMYLISDDNHTVSEMNYLLVTDGNYWYYVDGPYIGEIVIDGSDNVNKDKSITNEDIAKRLRKALKKGDIDPIHDFIFDCIAYDSELEEFRGYTIEDIMNDSPYEIYYWHIASEYAC